MANTTADPRSDQLRTVILNELKSRGLTRYWLAKKVIASGACRSHSIVYMYLTGQCNTSSRILDSMFAALDLTVSRW